MKSKFAILGILFITHSVLFSQSSSIIMVQGARYPGRTIYENASGNKEFSIFVQSLTGTDLQNVLQNEVPVTVFAPRDQAFKKLPKAVVEALLDSSNKENLSNILKYHVVPGRFTNRQLVQMIRKNSGVYKAKTLQGGELTFTISGKNIIISDQKGSIGQIAASFPKQRNGVIYAIDTVMLPGS